MWNDMFCYLLAANGFSIQKLIFRCAVTGKAAAAPAATTHDRQHVFAPFNLSICLLGQIIDRTRTWSITTPNQWTLYHLIEKNECGCLRLRRGKSVSISTCSSVWPSEIKWATRTKCHAKTKKKKKMAYIHRKMDNKILLFASDIFKWSLFFHSFFFGVRISGWIVLADALTQWQMILFVHHQI